MFNSFARLVGAYLFGVQSDRRTREALSLRLTLVFCEVPEGASASSRSRPGSSLEEATTLVLEANRSLVEQEVLGQESSAKA